MTILILSPFFYPEPISTGKYNTVLAEGLVSGGEDVLVFASHPLYPQWQPVYSAVTLPDVRVIRGGNWLRYPKSAMLRRFILESWYAVFACIQYLRLSSKPTHVVPIFPPSLFFLILSSLLDRSSVIVGIVHDLQGVYAKRSSSMVGRFLQAGIHWVESRCFARCERLIFLSHSMKDRAVREYGLSSDRCLVCYPFVASTSIQPKCGSELAEVFSPEHIHAVYSGALGDKQNPDGLFDFLNALGHHNKNFRSHIFSAGPHFERLKSVYSRQPNCLVEFHDLVPSEQLDELYMRSSVQVIPQAKGTADGSLPSKLPNLLAAGVPIFAICDAGSELGYIVNKANAGCVAESWLVDELIPLFDTLLLSISEESKASRRDRLSIFVEENFSVQKVVREILGG